MNHNAREFLDYIAVNERRLKKNLRKNVTYDDEIFDDVFQTAILKVYNSIVKNDKRVDDFEKYFFIASKFEYILVDNRNKKYKAMHQHITDKQRDIIDEDELEAQEKSLRKHNRLIEYLYDEFGSDADVYLRYYRTRIEKGRTSYKKISEEFGISVNEVSLIIQKIKKNIEENQIYKLL